MTNSNGINLEGFGNTKPVAPSPWATENYTEAPKSAFPASDKSSQGESGLTNKMVHSVEETRNFGAGN